MEIARDELETILEAVLDKKLDEKLARQTQELKDFILVENTHLVSIIQETIVQPMEERFISTERKLVKMRQALD